MTLALREPELAPSRVRHERRAAVLPGPGRGPMLDEVLAMTWAALSTGSPAACPVCDGTLLREPDSAAARCRDCGAELS